MSQDRYIKFIQEGAPALENGSYQIIANGLIHAGGQNDSDSVTQKFILSGKRFSISKNMVHSVYPSKGNMGDYKKVLPHIIFRNHELPWERRMNFNGTEKYPWMALVVFEEGSGVKMSSVSLEELLNSDNGRRIIPDIQIEEENGESKTDMCNVLDIPRISFQKVAPKQSDLPYLAHIKQTSLDNKATNEDNMQDLFACLLSNRFAQSGENALQNHAYVVSLEGYERMMQAGWDQLQGDTVRIVCLYDWTFLSQNNSSNGIKDVIENLDVDTLQEKDSSYPINCGYIPVNHKLKNGDKTVSWYRGPLLPVTVEFDDFKQSMTANDLIRFDPENAMFDVSYSSAWQLGKLLSLMNDSFSRKLLNYNMNLHEKLLKGSKRNQNRMDLNCVLNEINEKTKTSGESRGVNKCIMESKKIEPTK